MFPGLLWWFTSSLISQGSQFRFWQGKCEIFILKCILCSLSIRTVDKPTVTKTSLSLCNKSFISTESSLIGKLDPVIMTDKFAGLLSDQEDGDWRKLVWLTDWLTDWPVTGCCFLYLAVTSHHSVPVPVLTHSFLVWLTGTIRLALAVTSSFCHWSHHKNMTALALPNTIQYNMPHWEVGTINKYIIEMCGVSSVQSLVLAGHFYGFWLQWWVVCGEKSVALGCRREVNVGVIMCKYHPVAS